MTGECCEWCQGEFKNSELPVFFAEKPFHPWCRDQFEDEMYGEDLDPALIDALCDSEPLDAVEQSLEDLASFF